MNFIWNIALHNKFGEYTKSKRIWGKELITYYETPYFFEIDLLYPHQTKDMVLFSEFIKEIIVEDMPQKHFVVHFFAVLIYLKILLYPLQFLWVKAKFFGYAFL